MFYIISHERSGTHFLINSIMKNFKDLNTQISMDGLKSGYDDIKNARKAQVYRFWDRKFKDEAIIKSHCSVDVFNEYFKPAPVIYMVRNIFDTLTSCFHYWKNPEFYRWNHKIDVFQYKNMSEFLRTENLTEFLKFGQFDNPDFKNVVERHLSHTNGWLQNHNVPVLFVCYEELYYSLELTLLKIKNFLNKYVKNKKFILNDIISVVQLKEMHSILPRKGIVGDYVNYMNDEDIEFIINSRSNYLN